MAIYTGIPSLFSRLEGSVWEEFIITDRFSILKPQNKNKNSPGGGGDVAASNNPPLECGLISLINSYLAFSFCHFSKTTLL